MQEPDTSARAQANNVFSIVLQGIVLVAAVLLARRNVKLKRSDTRGAVRLAAFVLAIYMLQHILTMYHAPSQTEWARIGASISKALYNAALVWLLYLAVEPFVRRRWPKTIVSWTRILGGKLRDPLVGGDILIGTAFGLLWALLFEGLFLIDQSRGGLPNPSGLGDGLLGLRYLFGGFAGQLASSVISAFASFFVIFLLRLLLRNEWLTAAVFVAIFVATRALGGVDLWTIPFFVVVYAVFALLLLRYGIVPLIVGTLTVDCLLNAPLTANFSSWYVTSSLVSLLVFLAIAAYGFRSTVAGKSLIELE